MQAKPPPSKCVLCDGPGTSGGSDSSGSARTTQVGMTRPSGRYSVRGTSCDPSSPGCFQSRTNTSTAGQDHGRTTEFSNVRGDVGFRTLAGRGLFGAWVAYQSFSWIRYRPIAVATTFG